MAESVGWPNPLSVRELDGLLALRTHCTGADQQGEQKAEDQKPE
jgi:hypothetical protein